MPSGSSVVARIERAFKKYGVPYRVIAGAASRGSGNMGTIRTITAHHTAGALRGNAPSRNVVKNGRPGLRNALCNLFLPRDGVWEIMAGRTAWHAGKVRRASYTNSHNLGIEAENTGVANDSPWPKKQYDSYALGCKALAEEFGASVLGHKEICSPPGRKIDPSFSMPAFRTHMGSVTGGAPTPTPEEETMKLVASGRHSKAQTINPGQKRRIQVTKEGYYSLGGCKSGQLSDTTVFIGVTGLLSDEKAIVRRVVVDYNAKKKTQTIRHRSDFLEVRGAADHAYVRENGVFTEVSGYGPRGDEVPRYHLEVENRGRAPITVTDIAFTTKGN